MKRAPRFQKPIGKSVVEAAKDRIRYLADTYDTIVVAFSGGKDSQVLLHLVHEALGQPVNVVFRDQEILHPWHLETVERYYNLDWIRMIWLSVPMRFWVQKDGKRETETVTWSRSRKHFRPMPEWAIRAQPTDRRVFTHEELDRWVANSYPGKVALLTGVVASESARRHYNMMSRLHETFIGSSVTSKLNMCFPIYDWRINDVFRYLLDCKAEWCRIYERKWNVGMPLRVTWAGCEEEVLRHADLLKVDPEWYTAFAEKCPWFGLQNKGGVSDGQEQRKQEQGSEGEARQGQGIERGGGAEKAEQPGPEPR